MEGGRSFVNADYSAPAAEFAIQPPPKKSKNLSTKAQENLDAGASCRHSTQKATDGQF